jgi:hypothetical protein
MLIMIVFSSSCVEMVTTLSSPKAFFLACSPGSRVRQAVPTLTSVRVVGEVPTDTVVQGGEKVVWSITKARDVPEAGTATPVPL